jgi:hypothetical protein
LTRLQRCRQGGFLQQDEPSRGDVLTLEAYLSGDWRAVIEAHDQESKEALDWLRYALALLQTMSTESADNQDEPRRAFQQARQLGASLPSFQRIQRQSTLLSLAQAMDALAMPAETVLFNRQAARLDRLVKRELIHGNKPIIRTVHHLACTGGTVISKCLAAMPKVALISEVNPLNRFGKDFEPSNPLLLLERSYRNLTLDEIEEDFLNQIRQAMKICGKDNVDLIIRDHSHTDFCIGPSPTGIRPIVDFLDKEYALVQVVTVRHPLDSYLGLLAAGWETQFSPSSLEEYARRYMSFLDGYAGVEVMKYEDFTAAPDEFMENMCDLLEVSYSSDYIRRFGDIKLSGDSGRKSTTEISLRQRRELPGGLMDEIRSSLAYHKLLERLDYTPDAGGKGN